MGMNDNRQWQIFQLYNAYRLLVIAVLFFFNPITLTLNPDWPISFYYFLSCYAITIFLFAYFCYSARLGFVFLVVLSILTDLIYLNALLFIGGTLSRGAGIFLNVALAAFCILKPGILGLFFAALESVILLIHSVVLYYIDGTNNFFYTGINGVGLFAVAITALMLAKRVKRSSVEAETKSKELIYLQGISEYIIERLQSGVVLTDENNRIQMINEMAKTMFEKDKIKPMQPLSDLSQLIADKVKRWATQAHTYPAHYTLKKQNFMLHLLPHPAKDKRRVLIIIEDLSHTLQRAQQLKLASLGQFTASISHELRNPLGAISHAVQLLKESDSLKEEEKRLSDIIHNNCDRMNALIKNVLQISRGQKSEPTAFLAKNFLTQFRNKTFLKGCSNLTIFVEPADIKIYFDKSQLSQLLVILIENSIKYGRNELDEVNITIRCYYDKHQRVCLTVCDEGKGVDSSIQDKIFDPFFTTTRSGVGLGLFIAKELCDLNQAKLSLDPSEKGAVFKIYFRTMDELPL